MRDSRAPSRRSFLRAVAFALGALGLRVPGLAAAAEPDDEPTPEAKAVLRQRFGKRPLRRGHVDLTLPAEAPDARVVPLIVETDLPMRADDWVKAIHIVVDHNPDIYVAGFQLTPALGAASVDTRIKLRRTSFVRAIVERSNGELWYAATKVYAKLNGCV